MWNTLGRSATGHQAQVRATPVCVRVCVCLCHILPIPLSSFMCGWAYWHLPNPAKENNVSAKHRQPCRESNLNRILHLLNAFNRVKPAVHVNLGQLQIETSVVFFHCYEKINTKHSKYIFTHVCFKLSEKHWDHYVSLINIGFSRFNPSSINTVLCIVCLLRHLVGCKGFKTIAAPVQCSFNPTRLNILSFEVHKWKLIHSNIPALL